MKKSIPVLDFRALQTQSPAASSTPRLSELKSRHALFIDSQKATPAELSEAYSKIKKQLMMSRSVDVVKKSIEQLHELLIKIESSQDNSLITTVKMKSMYLLACCMLYHSTCAKQLDLELCESALDLIEIANELGLGDLEQALETSTYYYEKSIELSQSFEAHQNRVDTCLLQSPRGDKIEIPLRKVVGIKMFLGGCTKFQDHLFAEMSKQFEQLICDAIDYDPRMEKERYLSPRLTSGKL
ncbi:hypothetical protein [Legionella worsleiensis]|uniref:Uncharacterized protein n=1 Tax=Legionella worsleiensis TaxID=45076 RepID=A0A0W1A5T0_9GAMM|nr:hypothetical protein [Legionella worsleiensis]KTD76732.1 hypothetical protein Lwor_1957 [Legionella worsleiensis]STY30519.1 Uncharacterised protein [Legionella worsleiensis]